MRLWIVMSVAIQFVVTTGLWVEAAPQEPMNPASQSSAELPKVDPDLQTAMDHILPDVNFSQIQLGDAVDFLRDISGCNIFFDWRALKTAGIDPTTLIDLRLRNAKFSAVLEALIERAGKEKAAFRLEDNLIIVSTPGQLEDLVKAERNSPMVSIRKNAAALDAKDQATLKLLDLKMPDVNFKDVQLSDAIEFLTDVTGSKIVVNWKMLEKEKVGKTTPVSEQVHNIKFGAALTLALQQLETAGITYTLSDGVIYISTLEDLKAHPNLPAELQAR